MKVKKEGEKAGLKFTIQKTKIMASGPTTSWEIDGETVETVSDFIFPGSKITEDGDCSHEIKRCLLLGNTFQTWPRGWFVMSLILLTSVSQSWLYISPNQGTSQKYRGLGCFLDLLNLIPAAKCSPYLKGSPTSGIGRSI